MPITINNVSDLDKVRVRKGSFTLGTLTHSCLPTTISIQPSNTTGSAAGDNLEVLCGGSLPPESGGSAGDLTANLVITALQDFIFPDGLIAQSWKENGNTLDFTWSPTADAQDQWRGKVRVQALEVGGEVGSRLTTSVSWEIVELFLPHRFTAGADVQVIPAIVAGGVTAGAPGAFTPAGAKPPFDLNALKNDPVLGDAVGPVPATAWSTGQYVLLGDRSQAHWDGTVWLAGAA